MAVTFSEDFLYELRNRCAIEDVVAKYVDLKKSSSSLVGLCPFHSEKTPSFHVTPSKQMFYCFGCNTGGDVISFIMKIENLSYPEAIKFLADMVGLPIPQTDVMENELSALRKKILDMNRIAARFFHETLLSPQGKVGLNYLISRKLTPQTIRRFGLGYSPDSWDALIKHMTAQGYSMADLKASGLVSESPKGIFDRFRGRVMFPIIDHKGNVIGFGGRSMEKDPQAKYLNTSENLVFKKGQNLFALNISKNSKSPDLILCEGYMDVISLHQNGFDNAVASLGTALTPDQARLIRRYKDGVVLCYDSDEAGKKATARALDILPQADLKVRVITVDGGKDPDELLKTDGGREKFKRLIDGSTNSVEYRLEKIKNAYNLSVDSERIECIRKMVGVLLTVKDPIGTEIYTDKISKALNISKESISAELRIQRDRLFRERKQQEQKKMATDLRDIGDRINPQRPKFLKAARAEEDIISALLHSPEMLIKLEKIIDETDFVTDFNRRVFNAVCEKIRSSPTADQSLLLAENFSPEEVSHINLFMLQTGALSVTDAALEESIKTLKEEKQKSVQSAFTSDEALFAQLEHLKGKKQDGQ